MRIFLIAGKSGSGKNEVAKYIKEYFIYKLEESVITSYSKYIKSFARELTDWDGNPETKPRKFLQDIGRDIRKQDSKYFTRRMIEDISIYSKYVQNVIIDDVRMPLEIEEMRDNYDNVYALYIVNQFGPSKLSVEEQADITETALENYSDFDLIIANDDQKTLKDKVFKFLEGIE
jgi:dephospho-CoA kinase